MSGKQDSGTEMSTRICNDLGEGLGLTRNRVGAQTSLT